MTGKPRNFNIQADSDNSKITISINETPGVKAENLSLATWGSSYILANQLHRWKSAAHLATKDIRSESNNNIPVLEIGAGTSLVGLSAAVIWQLRVTVTDLPSIVSGLEQNISANQAILRKAGSVVQAGTLDWANPSSLALPRETISSPPSKAYIILAADTVYAEDHPSLLTSTIRTWLAPGPHSRVMLCYVLRHSYIDIIRELWESFEAAGLECVEEGKQDADPDTWDDVAPFEWCVWRWK